MKLSARHVAELAAELAPLVTGTLVRSVDPLPPRDLLLVLEAKDARVRRVRFSADPEAARPYFSALRRLRDRLVAEGADPSALPDLSMGMSHDFEVAVEEGATMVRVGSAIFGPRP